MAQPITQTLLQNGSIIGLRLTGSIVDAVNNIEERFATKADKNDLRRSIDTNSNDLEYYPAINGINNIMVTFEQNLANLGGLLNTNYAELLGNIRALQSPQNFTLSNPPTLEEITEINKMTPGSFYTINNGTALMVFREPFPLPDQDVAQNQDEPQQ